MLTTEDLGLHFRCLARLASWRMLPLEVNPELGRIHLWSSRKKQAQYLVFAIVFSLHLLYVNLRTLESAFFDPDAPRFYLAWQIIVSCAMTTYLSWHHVFFVQFPDIFITLLDELLHPSQVLLARKTKKGSLLGRIRSFSLQELIALVLPCVVKWGILYCALLYIVFPDMKILLYSCIPSRFQHALLFFMMLIPEVLMLSFTLSMAIMVLTIQMMCFEKVTVELEYIHHEITCLAKYDEFLKVLAKLRRTQLFVGLFNRANCYPIFCLKLVCITLCILSGYSIILHAHESPVFGTVSVYIFMVYGSWYTVLYAKAFKVPDMVDNAKQILLHRLAKIRAKASRKQLRRRVRSIPDFGIKVGQFHMFEKLSTPTFIGFVLQNIVGLLLLHKQQQYSGFQVQNKSTEA